MMTNRIYEEEFTIEQLDAAAKVIGDALRRPGAPEKERYEAILKIANAYLSGYQPAKALDFIEARLREVKLDNAEKRELYIREARAYIQLENWNEAARMYRIARKYGPMRERRNLQDEGRVAEKRGDWRTAVICYSDETQTYSDEEKSQKKACIRRLAAVQAKLEKQNASSDITAIDELDDGTIIKLEE
jgi:tetratricopeptide (TPR) repeat protein